MFLTIDESKGKNSTTVGCLALPDSSFVKAESSIVNARVREKCWGEIKWQYARSGYAAKYVRILDDFFKSSAKITFHSLTYKKLAPTRKAQLKQLFPKQGWSADEILNRRIYHLIRTVIWKCKMAGYDSKYYIVGDRLGGGDEIYRVISDLLAKDRRVKVVPEFCSTGNSAVLGSLQITDLCTGAVASCYEPSYHQTDTAQIKEKIIEINGGLEINYSSPRLPRLHDYRLHHWLFDETKSRHYGYIF